MKELYHGEISFGIEVIRLELNEFMEGVFGCSIVALLGKAFDDLGEDVGGNIWVSDEGVNNVVGFSLFSEDDVDLVEVEQVVEGGIFVTDFGFQLGASVEQFTALDELITDGF